MLKSILVLCLLLTFLTLPSAVKAQGTAFTYQGRLSSGTNLGNGLFDFQFALHSAATGLAQVGSTLTTNAVPVTNGLFTVSLDFGNQFPGADRWLDISVRTNGASLYTNLTPRQKLTATPYAVQALSAGSATSYAGAITDGQLSGNIARLNASNVFSGVVQFNSSSNVFKGSFTGNGAGVTNVNLALNSGGAITLSGGFVLASSPGVGDQPQSVTATDVNGDGKVDLISANFNADTLSVLTNDASGGFLLASSPNAGSYPVSVAAADVNGDGKVDLISANLFGNTLTLLTNKGSGGFALASSSSVGTEPQSVVSADVNGDGKADLISANANATLSVLTNSGSGGLVLASSPGVGPNPLSVTAADVNGDGRMDLISANFGGNSLTVLTNKGSGGFLLSTTLALGTGTAPYSVAAADVNGDGKMDLISANSNDDSLSILTNNGSGGFVLASKPAAGAYPISVVAADINGDSKSDLICANYSDKTLTVFRNNGSGGFVLASSPMVGPGPYSVVAADVNGDGKLDLISANQDATLSVLFNTFVFSGSFSGTGAGLTGLNAANLVGSVPSASLTSIPAESLTGDVPAAVLTAIPAEFLYGSVPSYTLTSVPAASLTGTITEERLSANVPLLGANQTFIGNNTIASPSSLSFGATTRQMINLWGTQYGIGIQDGTMYFRCASDPGNSFAGFRWYRGGVHANGNGNSGGGTELMSLGSTYLYINGTFVSSSDRNVKENFGPVQSRDVLEKVVALPITHWSYKSDAGTLHIGPVAQDFYAAFGLGTDDKHISMVDSDGVALSAIQGLNQKVEEQSKTMLDKEKRIADLEDRITRLENLISKSPAQ